MSEPTTIDPLVTIEELASRLQVSSRTLRRWRDQGMPHYAAGSTLRFRVSEVEAWMRGDGPDESTGAAA